MPARVAVVTGANQGLGLALAAGLARLMHQGDVVYLTGRDPGRVARAAAGIEDATATVEPRVLDVTDADAIDAFADELGEIDIMLSNAAARMVRARTMASQVQNVLATNNLATTHILRTFSDRVRPRGRLLIVASSLGTLKSLPPHLHDRFSDDQTLDDVDATMRDWAHAVTSDTGAAAGWPEWINLPSKVGQVAAVRAAARARHHTDIPARRLLAAVCPGLIDTEASRPWFDDMSQAQTPDQAATAILELALGTGTTGYGELLRVGQVVPWRDATPSPPAS